MHNIPTVSIVQDELSRLLVILPPPSLSLCRIACLGYASHHDLKPA